MFKSKGGRGRVEAYGKTLKESKFSIENLLGVRVLPNLCSLITLFLVIPQVNAIVGEPRITWTKVRG